MVTGPEPTTRRPGAAARTNDNFSYVSERNETCAIKRFLHQA